MTRPAAVDLSRLSPQAQWAALAGSAGLLAAAAWILALSPLIGAVRGQANRVADLKAMTAEAHAVTRDTAAHQAAYAAALADYQRVMQRVAGDQTLARVLESLGQQTKLHRLELSTIQPEHQDEPQRYAVDSRLTLQAVPIRVQVRGRYQHLGQFLEAVASAPYLASVRQVEMARAAGEGRLLDARIVVDVYLTEEPGA